MSKIDEEIKQCINAQKLYAKNTMKPEFQPSDGKCYYCHLNIYQDYNRSGYNLARAASSLTTGCPHCNKSFCD